MSTATATSYRTDGPATLAGASGPPVGAPSAAPVGDEQLVLDTKQQIRALVSEIESLVAADVTIAEFYTGFLERVVTALAANGGALWTKNADGEFACAYRVNFPADELQAPTAAAQHTLLLSKLWETEGQPQLVPPHAGSQQGQEAGNPTGHLLVIAPLAVEQQTLALVEIFQRPGGGPTTQRGYLRFLMQMCALGSDFLKNRRLKQYQDQQALWRQFEAFIGAVHRQLDIRHTAYTLANEGRRLSGGDRVSVLLGSGARAKIVSVSGLDSIDRRSAEVRLMENLARVVLKAGEPVYFSGDNQGLPPQIDDALHDFVDVSQARAVCVIPLALPEAEGTARRPAPLGALVVERWEQSRWHETARERVRAIATHGAAALRNAQEHQSLFLLPLWKALGKVAWLGKLPKAFVALGALSAVIAALVLAPYDFQLSARGKLQPSDRRDIFAATDGVVVDVPVDHADPVQTGQILATLRNTDLDVEIATLLGRQTTLAEQVSTAQRALLNESQLSLEEQNRIAGELLEFRQALESTQRQLDLLALKQQQLVVRSDRPGQVVTWKVRDLLLSRPVQRGQVLMTLVDPAGEWELELQLPEKRLGHALAAWESAQQRGEPLVVSFQLSTHPGLKFHGQVTEIERRAAAHDESGNLILVRVAIDKTRLPELHSETTVTAQLHCGERPLGYVLFQDVIEAVHKQVLLWL